MLGFPTLDDGSDDDDAEFSGDNGWIAYFCGLKGHEILAEVDEDYARDNFNLYGLRGRFQYYDHALEMILSSEAPDEDDLADTEFLEIYRDAAELYGIIHSRYIASPRGLQVMREKYMKGTFGTCPRAFCGNQHVLPIGIEDEMRLGQVRVFCPRCEQVYAPKSKFKDVDGASFGTSFPQIFLQTYPSLIPLEPPVPFVPRVFGFKLHKQHSLITRKLEAEQGPGSSSSAAAAAGAQESRAAAAQQQQHRSMDQDGSADDAAPAQGVDTGVVRR